MQDYFNNFSVIYITVTSCLWLTPVCMYSNGQGHKSNNLFYMKICVTKFAIYFGRCPNSPGKFGPFPQSHKAGLTNRYPPRILNHRNPTCRYNYKPQPSPLKCIEPLSKKDLCGRINMIKHSNTRALDGTSGLRI